jgi:hypothetical protein
VVVPRRDQSITDTRTARFTLFHRSINGGFATLREILPETSATDSKAAILQKGELGEGAHRLRRAHSTYLTYHVTLDQLSTTSSTSSKQCVRPPATP